MAHSLNRIRNRTGNQRSCIRAGVTKYRPVTCTRSGDDIEDYGRPANTELQPSNDVDNNQTSSEILAKAPTELTWATQRAETHCS
jgi:hypothetical protein